MQRLSLGALTALSVLAVPLAWVQAAGGGIDISYVQSYADSITFVVNGIFVPILLAVAFFYFLLGVYQYFILGGTDPKKIETGRYFVSWSVIGFAAIFSVWGLVWVVLNTFGLRPGGVPPAYPLL